MKNLKKLFPKKWINYTLIFLFCFTGCTETQKSTTEKMLQVGDTLLKVIDEFDQARNKMIKVVTDFATNIEKFVTENPKNIAQTADKWEKEWGIIANEIKELETKFQNVDKSSTAYFNQLSTLTDNIQNTTLRESEEKKNQELRNKWDAVTKEANADMDKIRSVLHEGNDFKNVLMSSAIRAKIDDNITQIKGISRKAKDILSALAKFSVESKKVIKGEKINVKTSTEQSASQKEITKKNSENKTDSKSENLEIENVLASSFLKDNSMEYRPQNTIDQIKTTWWSPTSSKNYTDEWISFELKESKKVSAFEILNGSYFPNYPNMGDIFTKNYRIKKIKLSFDENKSEIISLKDTQEIQTIKLKEIYKTQKVKLTILEVYPSEKWEDICISHFAIFGEM